MPTRARKTWRLSSDGQYVRQIGWTVSRSGNRVQAKFRLGANRKEAKRRDQIIRSLWDQLEHRCSEKPATWSEEALAAAKSAAATGHATLVVQSAKEESWDAYFWRIAETKSKFEGVQVTPADERAYGLGRAIWASGADTMKWINHIQHGRFELPEHYTKAMELPRDLNGPTLHGALRAYIPWLQKEFADPEREVTAWGRTQIRQVGTLLDRHADRPLSELDFGAVEEMIRYWRKRPLSRSKGATGPIAKKSAGNYIKTLKGFLKWLHRSDEFVWRRPEGLDDIKTRIEFVEGDRLPQVIADDLFSLEELALLYKYATSLERTFLLLSLNCHFGGAEISSLRVGEVSLRTSHSKKDQEVLAFASTREDSFIRRLRGKTSVYGEWILFPETVAVLDQALERRRLQPDFSPEARLLLNSQGKPYDTPTASGNANQQIANRFADLIRRIQNDGHKEFAKRPFKMVRKTAATMIREIADGEIQGLFTSHGQPVATDDLADVYAVRPFGKLFVAIRELQSRLKPVFGQDCGNLDQTSV